MRRSNSQNLLSVLDELKAIPSKYLLQVLSFSRQAIVTPQVPLQSAEHSLLSSETPFDNSTVALEAFASDHGLVNVAMDVCNGSMAIPSAAGEDMMLAYQTLPPTFASIDSVPESQPESAVTAVSWWSRIGGFWSESPSEAEDDLAIQRKEFYALVERRRQEFEAARIAHETALLASYVQTKPMVIEQVVAQSPTIRPVSFSHEMAKVCQLLKDLFWFCAYIAIAVAIGSSASFVSKARSVPTVDNAPRPVAAVKTAARNTRPAVVKGTVRPVPFVPKRGSPQERMDQELRAFRARRKAGKTQK